MIWKKDIKLDIVTYGPHHIDTIAIELSSCLRWRITGFYGHSDTYKSNDSWKLLTSLHHQFQLPWLCLKDFNEIILMGEKWGGVQRSQH